MEDCVNSVGVDLNTASAPLLRRVAGVTAATAKNIVALAGGGGSLYLPRPAEKGEGPGPPRPMSSAPASCGCPEAKNRLDATAVHPESYAAAKALLEACGYTTAQIGTDKLSALPAAVKAEGGEEPL